MNLKPYPEYKVSGVEWIGEIPKDWNVEKLKFSSTINKESLPENKDLDYEFFYLDISNVSSNGKILNLELMRLEDAPSRARRIPNNHDTIISTVRTYLKAISYLDGIPDNFIVSTGFSILNPKKNIFPRYLYYLVSSDIFVQTVVAYSKGIAYPAINSSDLANLPIWYPDFETQKKLSSFLDKKTSEIDLTIEKDSRLIELLKEKRTALINHVVTKGLDPMVRMKDSGVEWIGEIPEDWNINRLKFLAAKKAQYGANEEPEYNENKFDYRYVRITDVNDNGGLKKDSFAYLSKENARGFILEEGDVLFARSGATVGKVYYYSSNDGNCCFAGYMIRYVTNKELLISQFLLYYSLSKSYKEWIKVVSTQSTIENVSADKYDELYIPTPNISEQKQIVEHLDGEISQIDGIIIKIEQKILLLEEYKKSLIHHVVTGKVDVREVAI
ncbi:MAG: restriction endonuclease subunit S [Methanobacterium sp.]|jgi:type I restriction enzyme S subunit